MATVFSAARVWTYADLEDMPDDGNRYDILGGSLVLRNVPDANHAVVLSALFGMLSDADEAGYGEVYTTSSAVALDYPARGESAIYVPHPDLFFIRQERAEALRGVRGWEGVPDLIVEILSPSTLAEHRRGGKWWDAYEQHGVPHYWLADPPRRLIYQYALEGERYVGGRFGDPVTLRAGDMLTRPLFPTVARPVERIFRRVRDEERPRRRLGRTD